MPDLSAPQIDFDMEAMKIKFGGQTTMIDANTLINSLLHFTNVVQEVHNSLSAELHVNKKIEIKINATQPGSFIMDLVIAAQDSANNIVNIFSKESLSYSANLVQSVGGVYNLAKFLKGKKPNKVEHVDNSVKIENNNGDIKYYDFRHANIYLKSPTIQDAIAQEFETLDQDPNVSGFELLDKNDTPLLETSKADFSLIADNDQERLTQNHKTITVSATLRIISLSWELRKKWEFYYEGNRITAKIKDDTFAEIIKNGEAFAMGDALEVEMDIVKELDETVDAYVNKSYTVTKIKAHLKRSETTTLNFPTND